MPTLTRVDLPWYGGGSRSLLAIVLALLIYLAAGAVLYLIIPEQTAAVTAQTMRVLFFSDELLPEPKERYTYLGLVFATPILLTIAVLLFRALPANWSLPCLGLYGAIIILLTAIGGDIAWSYALALAQSHGLILPIAFAAVLLGSMYLAGRFSQDGKGELPLRLALVLSIVAGALINFAWRVFDMHTVTNESPFYGHYDAMAYSIVQIAKGATCLVDVVPQYGCYGEFLAPVFHVFGLSTLTITATLATFQAVSFVLLCLVALRLIRNRWIALTSILFLIAALSRIWGQTIDPNYQNLPIRLIFPALALLSALKWQDRPTAFGASLLGVLSAIAVAWNLDSGAVVLAALALFVGFSGATQPGWPEQHVLSRLRDCIWFFGGAVGALALFYLWLSLKSQHLPRLDAYFIFQATFFGSGAFMLPIPAPPSLWHALIALPIAALTLFAKHLGKGPHDSRLEALALIAILSVGLFSYYVGRSHSQVLALIAWPYVLLGFAMLDLAWPRLLAWSLPARWLGATMLAFVAAMILSTLVTYVPYVGSTVAVRLDNAGGASVPDALLPQIDFLKANSSPHDSIAVLAPNQATLIAESGINRSPFDMSLIETLRVVDAVRQLEIVLGKSFDAVFLGYDACCSSQAVKLSPWIGDNFLRLRDRFALDGWDPSGKLMRLVPKASQGTTPDLFELGDGFTMTSYGVRQDPVTGKGLGRWGRPASLKQVWPLVVGDTFKIEMSLILDESQPPYATVLTNRFDLNNGVSIEMVEPNKFALFFGNGQEIMASPQFDLVAGAEHHLTLKSIAGILSLIVDGRSVFESNVVMIPSDREILSGHHYFGNRILSGQLIEFSLSNAVEPDYD